MGLKIETRCATKNDYPQIYELLDKVMYSTSEMLKGRYRNYPGTKPEHSRITVVDGKVVSHIRLYMAEAYYGKTRVKIGFIGDVCTDPEYRKKGYGAACLRDGIRYFAENGCHISMIFSGVLGFYASEGWRPYPVSTGVVNVEYLKPVPQEKAITVRRFERSKDLTAVAEIYEKFNQGRFLSIERTLQYWENSFYWIHGEREENFYVAEKGGRIIGYSRISGNQVTEMCYLPELPEAVPALWNSIVKWTKHWARRGVPEKELHVSVPPDHTLYPILKRIPLFHEITYYTMLLRIISFRGLLQALIPFFSEHFTDNFSQTFDLGQKIYPKWLSFKKGLQVPSQICYSNKGAVRVYTQNVLEYVEKHPEIDILGLWPSDGDNFCQCEKCRKNPFLILEVVNNIARKIYQINDKLIVEHIVYGERSCQVPSEDMDLSPNLIIFICYDGYKEWLSWLKRNVKQGFYRGEYNLGDNYANRGIIYPKLDQAKKWADSLVEDGFCGFSSFYIETSSWWRSTFNYYFFSKAIFGELTDIKEILKDYCNSYFGKFAEKIYDILLALLYEVEYPEEKKYIPDMLPVESVVNKNERIFSRIEKTFFPLKKKVNKDSKMLPRLKKLQEYIIFVRTSLAVHFLRGKALLAEKSGKAQEVVKKMLKVAQLEEYMQRLCQESFLNNDGVLDYRLFIYLRRLRFLEDKRMLERIKAFINQESGKIN